jgi:type II secretory pathway pseudopilin PulG
MMPRRSSSSQSESGYILLAVIFMMLLLLIALAVAAPRIAASIQRDHEAELVHRGEQYKHAIKLYYKKFGRYPNSIDQLVSTNKMRFLRKRYLDPMTGKDDWKVIHFGEAHIKPLGLFGQPIQNGGLSTTAGGSVLGGTPGLTNTNSLGSTSSFGGTSTIAPTGTSTDISGTSSTDPSGTTTPGSGSTSAFGGTSASTFGSGQSLGGAPIVGVVIKDTKASIKEYKKQKHYNEWEFVYDPVEDLMGSVSLLGGGTTNLNGNSGNPNSLSPTSPTSPTSPGTGTGFPSSPSPSPQQ